MVIEVKIEEESRGRNLYPDEKRKPQGQEEKSNANNLESKDIDESS